MLMRAMLILMIFGLSLSLYAQDDEMVISVETSKTISKEDLIPFDIPENSNINDLARNSFIDCIIDLLDEREKYNKNLESLEQVEAKVKSQGSPDEDELEEINTNIYKVKKKLNDIRYDMKSLESEYKNINTNSSIIITRVNEINSKYFPPKLSNEEKPIIKEEINESISNWDEEFSYLNGISDSEGPAIQNSDCQVIFDGVDKNTMQQKVQIKPENLISYTHPKLESYYKDNSFLTGDVSLVELGKNKYLVLDIIVRSKDALKNYGIIRIGSPMKIELLNGDSVYLFCNANAQGRLIPQTSHTKYQVLYSLPKSEYKALQKSEIDNVGIMWSSGYEKYDVYNVDVVMNQIECLDNFK